MGTAFASYTYTDISSGFFEKAREVFKDYRDCMIFKTLDAEKDPVSQGFQEHSYDLVLCSLVLHATTSLENTLQNVRRLLKPGGYLAMLEITNVVPIRMGFCMGGLEGWWLGQSDGRELNPCVTANQWNAALRKSGFSGIDAITPDLDPMPWPLSIIVAQAVDDRIDLLRRPLSAPTPESEARQLVLVGGTTLQVSMLADELQEILQPRYQHTRRIDTIEDFKVTDDLELITVLSLADLDEPVFKNLTEDRLEALRSIFDRSRNVLWLTKGARTDDPFATMMVGFGRTVVVEMPNVRLQLLDLESSQELEAKIVAETLLRLQATEAWDSDESRKKLLWSTEPELALENGKLMVPRVLPSKDRNDRYNSVRRPIAKEIATATSVASIAATRSSYIVEETLERVTPEPTQGSHLVTVRVSHSLPLAVRISADDCLFVVKGVIDRTSEHVIALTDVLASQVDVHTRWTVSCQVIAGEEDKQLLVFACELVAQYILATAAPRTTLLVHGSPPILARLLALRATETQIRCIFTTTQTSTGAVEAIYVHPQSPVRVIKALLPEKVSVFVDFSDATARVGAIIAENLPLKCTKISPATLLSKAALPRSTGLPDLIPEMLKAANAYLNGAFHELRDSFQVSRIPLRNIARLSNDPFLSSVIDWTASSTVSVQVEPVDKRISFKPDRTYLLLGLSGQLGRSLAQWMIRHGAKHIVLTSRRPIIDEHWMRKMQALGAEVRIIAK